MFMFIHVYVYVSIVYMLCSPMLEEIKNLSIYLYIPFDIMLSLMSSSYTIVQAIENLRMLY